MAKNLATGLVLTAPSPATSGTSLVLQSGEGARFSTSGYITAHPADEIPDVSNAEMCSFTRSTDTLTIVRAQLGTTAKSIAVGWRITESIYEHDLKNTSIITGETPTGSINGSNTAFSVASAYKTGTLKVYKNGVRMKGGGADYTENGNDDFTMVTAPATGTVLLVDYEVGDATHSVGTNSLIVQELPSGTINGSNTAFTTARAYIAGSLQVWLNGVLQRLTTDYEETTPASGILTFTTAPPTGSNVIVAYQYNLNPSSNADTVDGIHANSTPTANQLHPLNASGLVNQHMQQVTVACRVYRSAAQTIEVGTEKIAFDTEDFDIGGNFASGSFTAPYTGYYQVNVSAGLENVNAVGDQVLTYIYVNGAQKARTRSFAAGIGDEIIANVSDIVYATVGQTIEGYIQNATSATELITANTLETYMSIYLVGRA